MTAPAARSRFTKKASAGGTRPGQRQRTGGRHHFVARGDVVLDEHGDAMQRTSRPARLPLAVKRLGNRDCASGLSSMTELSFGPC